jgi:membrane-bound metal-dependent hydrolase YbcI (DUF457 family)
MPNRKTHIVIGAGAGAAFSVGVQAFRQTQDPSIPRGCNLLHVAACSVAAAMGARVPDLLEPASRDVGPNHRCKFHSVAAGALVVTYIIKATAYRVEHPFIRLAVDVACAFYVGYTSHLVADALTPKSIGLFHKRF